jgi:hypothetical protein
LDLRLLLFTQVAVTFTPLFLTKLFLETAPRGQLLTEYLGLIERRLADRRLIERRLADRRLAELRLTERRLALRF